MNGKIIVITHKDYEIPNDELYLPLCVGKNIDKLCNKFQPDNVGENISQKNETYCELTGIYWAYKNLDVDFIGIAHYRRYFTLKKKKKNLTDIINKEQVENLLKDNTVIVPKAKRYITTLKKHYINSKKGFKDIHEKDFENLRKSIELMSREYINDFDFIMNKKSAHMLNMFIMDINLYRNYCQWLFKIIDKTVELNKERIDQTRYAGALSEFLLDVYIRHNNINVCEVNIYETEKKNIIKKIIDVIKRKIL